MNQCTKIWCIYVEVDQWVETCHIILLQGHLHIHKTTKCVIWQVELEPLEVTASLWGVVYPAHLIQLEGKSYLCRCCRIDFLTNELNIFLFIRKNINRIGFLLEWFALQTLIVFVGEIRFYWETNTFHVGCKVGIHECTIHQETTLLQNRITRCL